MGPFSDFTEYAKETGHRLTDQPLLVEDTRRLDATRQALFDYITDFNRLHEWIWGAKRSWTDNTRAQVPGQVGSVRMIQPPVGKPLGETVKAYEAPRMLAYSADDKAFFGLCTDHLGVLTCEPHPDGGVVFCWLAYGRLARSPVKAWAGKKLFQVALGRSMKNLERILSRR
ncbi:MAG: SRPBCC family protein [Polyangiales bacterium]